MVEVIKVNEFNEYEGSRTLMHIFDRFGMYAELPEKKPKKAK